MRVLLVVLSSCLGGTERHAMELANGLAAAGCTVGVVLRKSAAAEPERAEYAALCALLDTTVRLFQVSRKMPLPALSLIIWRFGADIVHTHAERSTRQATRVPFRPPVIATNHCGWHKAYLKSDALICLTAAERQRVPHCYKGQIFTIGNWVLPYRPPSAQHVAQLRKELGLSEQDYVVGCVARFAHQKGIDGLIAGFLEADIPQGRLVLVGAGQEEEELRQLAAAGGNKVVFAGFRDDVRDVYSVFDLCVLNSRYEPYGLALLEALDAGVPVIATATDGACEIARHTPITLIPVEDTHALVAALQHAYAHKERKVGRKASDVFGREAVVCEVKRAYQAVIARSGRGEG